MGLLKARSCALASPSSVVSDLSLAGPIFVKGVADANPNAVDKCLDALLVFLQNTNEAQASRSAAFTIFGLFCT